MADMCTKNVQARFLHRLGNGLRAKVLDRIEPLRALFLQDTNQIDGSCGIPQRMRDGVRIAQIGLDRMDLTNLAERLQMKGEFGRRTATRTRQPRWAKARTTCRPRNPEPPKTVTSWFVLVNSSAIAADLRCKVCCPPPIRGLSRSRELRKRG